MSWTLVLLLSVGCYLEKAAGMLGLGRVKPDNRLRPIGALFPPALLAALVVVQTFGPKGSSIDASRVAGVLVGGLAAWRRAPFWLVLVIAAVTTAGLRRLGV